MRLRALDLFCGAGGFSEGFQQAGWEITAGVDNEPHALDTFGKNHEAAEVYNIDLYTEVPEVGEVDAIIGGPPCQGFSMAGRRQPTDRRNILVYRFSKIVSEMKPQIFLMENVPGILSTSNTGSHLIKQFEKVGYTINYGILNSANYGDPQVRRRVFFVGKLNGERLLLPKITHQMTKDPYQEQIISRQVWKTVGDVLAIDLSGSPNHNLPKHSEEMIKKISRVLPGESLYDYQSSWRRLESDKPAPTVRESHGGAFIHPTENRAITAREMACLQSFPTSYAFSGSTSSQIAQIGNAVPVCLAKALGESMMRQLSQ